MQNTKPLWQWPWKYKESILFLTGITFTGFILQYYLGYFPYLLLIFPNNLYLGGFLIIGLILFSFKSNTKIFKWITGIPFSVTIISFLLLLTLMMGITPQLTFTNSSDPGDWVSRLGLRNVTSSWSFVLIYFFTLISLGSLVILRLKNFKWKDYAFHLNHIGLFIIFLFGGLGASDIRRYQMHVEEGKEEWRVYNAKGEVLELPIAIHLNDFIMEEYKPKLTIIDKEGNPLPIENPEYSQIDEKYPEGILGKYKIHIKKYIHEAIKVNDSTFQEIKMPGACPAAYITVKNNETGTEQTQWVSSGSTFMLYKTLKLSENETLVMTQPEPKKFLSDIIVYTQKGETIPYQLEVNHPLKTGNWTIYQSGYDDKAGKLSTYSSFELVYDPWVNYIYMGMAMLALGCICLLWKGNKKTKKNDLE